MSASTVSQSFRGARIIVLAGMTALAGCSGFQPARPPLLDTLHILALPSANTGGTQQGVPSALWWTQFEDGRLNEFVRLAWEKNYDLRMAASRLSSSLEQVHVAEGARIPGVMLESGAARTRQSAAESKGGEPKVLSSAYVHASLSWELDLFGRVKHIIEAARASAEERAAVRDDIRRLLLAHVIEAYIDVRSAQLLGHTLQGQLDNQAGTLELVRTREASGSLVPAERMRVEAQYRITKSRLPAIAAQERAARNRLATLTGLRLDDARLLALSTPSRFNIPSLVVTDEPLQILRRRPDVKAAQKAVAAASARHGIAYADRFPRVTLSALFGNLGGAGDWLTDDANRWRAGGLLTWPIIGGGSRSAQYRAAGAEVEAARASFEKTVAVAMEESDTAISNWVQARRRAEELTLAHELAQDGARLSRLRFREGAESLLGVLEAERVALLAEEQLTLVKRDTAIAATRSYVAIAGGFDPDALTRATVTSDATVVSSSIEP